MPAYEYKTVAAPRRPKKARGVKGKDAQMAHAVEELIQETAMGGWEYHRTDIFPVQEGGGLFSRAQTVQRAVMVFRRAASQPQATAAQRIATPHQAPHPPISAQPAAQQQASYPAQAPEVSGETR